MVIDTEFMPESLDEVIKKCESLNQEEQHQLLQILQKYFDGTLGEIIMKPISLHLMDKGSKPAHVRPYTLSRSVEQQLRKEIARLEEIGVLILMIC